MVELTLSVRNKTLSCHGDSNPTLQIQAKKVPENNISWNLFDLIIILAGAEEFESSRLLVKTRNRAVASEARRV